MRLSLTEMLEKIAEGKTSTQKVKLLRYYDCTELRLVFVLAYDHEYVFDLPRGPIPYKPCIYFDQHTMFYRELNRIGKFLKGGPYPNMDPKKRLALFIQVLESIDPKDAQLLMALKDKKLPIKGIYRKYVNEAYGDIIPKAPWNQDEDEGDDSAEEKE